MTTDPNELLATNPQRQDVKTREYVLNCPFCDVEVRIPHDHLYGQYVIQHVDKPNAVNIYTLYHQVTFMYHRYVTANGERVDVWLPNLDW